MWRCRSVFPTAWVPVWPFPQCSTISLCCRLERGSWRETPRGLQWLIISPGTFFSWPVIFKWEESIEWHVSVESVPVNLLANVIPFLCFSVTRQEKRKKNLNIFGEVMHRHKQIFVISPIVYFDRLAWKSCRALLSMCWKEKQKLLIMAFKPLERCYNRRVKTLQKPKKFRR